MNKLLKQFELKSLIIGTIATLFFVISLVAIASKLTDLILFSIHKKEILFSIPLEQVAFEFDAGWRHFYEKWFWIVSSIISSVGFLIGGLITGLIAKKHIVFNGTIAGAIIAVLFLSWALPIFIIAAYCGAVLAQRKNSRNTIERQQI